MGAAQRLGGEAWFCDAEFTLDFERAELFGLNVGKDFHYFNVTCIEDLFDGVLSKALKGRKSDSMPGAMAVDSLSALPSKTELEAGLSDTGYGMTRAKQMSAAFRKYLWSLNQANLALIFVDQTRDDPANRFSKYTVSGGKALKFYASTRVLLEPKSVIMNKAKKPVGVSIAFTVTKNKIAPPFREGIFRLLFDIGIDDVATNLMWLRENSAVDDDDDKDKGAWYTVADQRFGPGLTKACQKIEEEGLEDYLIAEVERVWHEVYQPERRKRRHGSAT